MTDQQQSPPPPPPPAAPAPPQAEPKKKIGALGWIAIGCIGLIVVGGLLTFACTVVVAKKAKTFVDEVGDNPAMSAAEMIVRMNPNLDLVEKDEEAGTLTIYDKQKDETVTLDLEDVMSGQVGIATEGGEKMNFEIGQNEDGSFGATVTDGEGEVSRIAIGEQGLRIGSGDGELPTWLPRYKNAEVSSPYLVTQAGETSGTAMFNTTDPVTAVADAITLDLERKGFDVERTSYESAGVTAIMLSSTGPSGEKLSASVNSSPQGTTVAMNFSGGS